MMPVLFGYGYSQLDRLFHFGKSKKAIAVPIALLDETYFNALMALINPWPDFSYHWQYVLLHG
jgi:hypothetical protein